MAKINKNKIVEYLKTLSNEKKWKFYHDMVKKFKVQIPDAYEIIKDFLRDKYGKVISQDKFAHLLEVAEKHLWKKKEGTKEDEKKHDDG